MKKLLLILIIFVANVWGGVKTHFTGSDSAGSGLDWATVANWSPSLPTIADTVVFGDSTLSKVTMAANKIVGKLIVKNGYVLDVEANTITCTVMGNGNIWDVTGAGTLVLNLTVNDASVFNATSIVAPSITVIGAIAYNVGNGGVHKNITVNKIKSSSSQTWATSYGVNSTDTLYFIDSIIAGTSLSIDQYNGKTSWYFVNNVIKVGTNFSMNFTSYEDPDMFVYLRGSRWEIGKDITLRANLNFDAGTSNFVLNGLSASTITSTNKLFYDMEINKTTTTGNAFTIADSLQTNDLNILDGKCNFPYVVRSRDFNVQSLDTVTIASNLFVGRDLTFADVAILKKTGGEIWFISSNSGSIYFPSINVGNVTIKKTSKAAVMTLTKNLSCVYLGDSVGTLKQNGKKITVDSAFTVVDSLFANDTIKAHVLNITATAKMNAMASKLYYDMATADTIYNNSKQLGNLILNKTGGTLSQVGVSKYDTVSLTKGNFDFNDSLFCNVMYVEVDTFSISKPIICKKRLVFSDSCSVSVLTGAKIISVPGDTLYIHTSGRQIPAIYNRSKIKFY